MGKTIRMRTETTIKPPLSIWRGAVIAIALLTSLLWAVVAKAQAEPRMPVDRVVEALLSAGFEVEHIGRTWLGRIRIEASNG